ncbi:MAG: hypothetical protein K2X27_01240 [Candidatus Obscuribacterales bacterium]|nr:hypothetical protein [Candidatus Obscuribacterales bacterium]
MSRTMMEPSAAIFRNPWDLIDLEKYPVADKNSRSYQELVGLCRKQLSELGAAVLPGFVSKAAVEALAAEANELAPLAYHSTVEGNPYLTPEDQSLPLEDPRRMIETTSLGAVAYDQMPEGTLIRKLYEWDGLMEFLAAALGKDELFRYADKMGALNIAVMKDGDYLRWHFDQTDFVVSLLLQDCIAGGAYEFVPMIRNRQEENYDAVRRILKGSRDGVLRLDIAPGSLVLFEGRHALHRVTKIEGEVPRLIALLGYDTKPGVVSSDHLRYMRYGRNK